MPDLRIAYAVSGVIAVVILLYALGEVGTGGFVDGGGLVGGSGMVGPARSPLRREHFDVRRRPVSASAGGAGPSNGGSSAPFAFFVIGDFGTGDDIVVGSNGTPTSEPVVIDMSTSSNDAAPKSSSS